MQANVRAWESGGCLPTPLASIWITSVCPLRCRHCYEGRQALNARHLPKEQVFQMIDRLTPFVHSISFMGGEPTTHPDLPEICAYAHDRGAYTLLVTNGQQLDREMVRELKGNIDCMKIGMDGVSSDTHDAVRGRGTFARALQSWDVAASVFPVMCKFTVNAMNMSQLPQLSAFCRSIGARRLVINRWTDVGAGAEARHGRFRLSADQVAEINAFVQNVLKSDYARLPVSRSCSLDHGCREQPARTYYVTSTGGVAPCIFSGHRAIGTLFDEREDVAALLARVNASRPSVDDLHVPSTRGRILLPTQQTRCAL